MPSLHDYRLSYCKHKIYHYLSVSILCLLLPLHTRTGRTHALVETLRLHRIQTSTITSSSNTFTVTFALPDMTQMPSAILNYYNHSVKRSGSECGGTATGAGKWGISPVGGDDDQDPVPVPARCSTSFICTAIRDHAFDGLSVPPVLPTNLPQPRRRRLSFGPGNARFPAEGDGVDFGQPAGSAGELDQCRPFSVIRLSHSERLLLPQKATFVPCELAN
jgi:hypothetical protein